MKNKEVLIDDNLEQLYKNFGKYKSFWNKHTKFIYEGNNEEIHRIVSILNINVLVV